MKLATAHLQSVSPYSPSRPHLIPRDQKETWRDFEERTWRDHCHVNEDGQIFIPPMAFKNALSDAARFLQKKVPGKGGKATFSKHFDAGVLVLEGLVLPVKKTQVEGEWLFLASDGKINSQSRVEKCYPIIREWQGDVQFHVMDDTITQDAFEEHLIEAGRFIGIGRFRPRNRGFYGRFSVKGVDWQEIQ